MNLRDRSLNLQDPDGSGHAGVWTVFSDVALSLLLVLVLFVLAQFLHYDNIAVIEEIDRRRAEVAEIVRQVAQDSTASSGSGGSIEIESYGFTAQRITFPEPMLFDPCGIAPRLEGALLIAAIGRGLSGKSSYFEAIQIEGHADRVPPSGPCQERVQDNWGLSSLRATAFLRAIVGPEAFPDSTLTSAVGRGSTLPRSSGGSSPEELERDRRVEVILLYSEVSAREFLRADRGNSP